MPDLSRSIRGATLAFLVLITLVMAPATSQAALASPARGTTISATDAVHLRAGPSTSDTIMTTAAAGSTATVLNSAPSNGFYRVGYQGLVGWTHGDYWNTVPGLVVNGRRLSANEESAVRWIAANTMPRVQGTVSERLTMVSRVSWWSLKEGVLGRANPHSFSNCGDYDWGPLTYCAAPHWQVGLGGSQVANFPTLATSEAAAVRLYPGSTVRDVLAHTATYAGYPAGTTGHNQIVNSGGTFRISWLLRNHGVGFTLNAALVADECVSRAMYWCYGTGWAESAAYAPTRAAALRAIGELRSILYAIAS
ncbi:SH3 domain-containing protein [Actinokineospora sp.]|uniref:SH3 domain-containing protein n=1 Tax=Actinokineospora sp. TaxID=1872133 RepID=UPI0040380D66